MRSYEINFLLFRIDSKWDAGAPGIYCDFILFENFLFSIIELFYVKETNSDSSLRDEKMQVVQMPNDSTTLL